ncbi:hypothetical protein GOBAR_AA32093 [Gossypium barbadense]|uniref:Uncharacterized protein n=1 Tax=Gossypium barbadense TaxID=3634 RepID=A0A2P5WBW9_GOSBA|nr:hypothetical protein GOBAR_AA32093 [Gossypium barbadense]
MFRPLTGEWIRPLQIPYPHNVSRVTLNGNSLPYRVAGHFMVPTLLHQRGPKISFGARPSRTSDAPRCRCCPMLRHIEGAGGARWPRTTRWHTARPGAKGAGGSSCKRGGTGTIHSLLGRIPNMHATVSEFYLWDGSFIIGYRTSNSIRILAFGIGEGLVAPFCISRDGSLDHRRDGSSEHLREPNQWWGAPTCGHAMGVGSALDNP